MKRECKIQRFIRADEPAASGTGRGTLRRLTWKRCRSRHCCSTRRASTHRRASQLRHGLTAREAEVLSWVAAGKTNRDIAEILGMSPRTANKHLERILAPIRACR